jgi:hypothetical protein
MDDTRDTPIHRIAVSPTVSAVLPLNDIKRNLEEAGLVVLGVTSRREDDTAESGPSVLP